MQKEYYFPYEVGLTGFLVRKSEVSVLFGKVIEGHGGVDQTDKSEHIEGQDANLLIVTSHVLC